MLNSNFLFFYITAGPTPLLLVLMPKKRYAYILVYLYIVQVQGFEGKSLNNQKKLDLFFSSLAIPTQIISDGSVQVGTQNGLSVLHLRK